MKKSDPLGFCSPAPRRFEAQHPMFRFECGAPEPSLVEWMKSFKKIIVLGFGGSILPLRCLVDSAGLQDRLVCFDELDTGSLQELVTQDHLFCVVSKSGETLEIKALLKELLQRISKNKILTVTDEKSGALRKWTETEGLKSFPIPTDIGGRFTHFSIFHRALFESQGVDFQSLLKVAKETRDALIQDPQELENIFQLFYESDRVHQIVLFAYGRAHASMAYWMQQALAESLGKKRGKFRVGKFPIVLRGPQDQHSVLQLLMDGPQTSGLWFLHKTASGAGGKPAGETGPGHHALPEWLDSLKAQSLESVEAVLAEATYRSFEERLKNPETAQPLLRWEFDSSLEEMTRAIVKVQAFIEYAGARLGINAFDQPGVERGKKIARELLNA